MRLYSFPGENGVTNFGDELNHYLWPRLLPGAFDDDDGTQFVGIGTLLNDRLPVAPRTVVFGAGVGYYGPPRRDGTWKIYCVRGPLSARALALAPEFAVTDPAVLIVRTEHCSGKGDRWPHAFMPHWQSHPAEWEGVCRHLHVGFIDPRWPPQRVLEALSRTDLLITEAMHGAIVADTFRIPWVPVRSNMAIKSFKWEDWCQSVGLEYRPAILPPLWPKPLHAGAIRGARRWTKLAWASWTLASIVRRARPVLSRADVLQLRIRQLEDRLEQLMLTECEGRQRFRATQRPNTL